MVSNTLTSTQINTGMPAIRPAGVRKPSKAEVQLKLFKHSRVGVLASAVRRVVMSTIDNTRFSEAIGKIQNCLRTWAEVRSADGKIHYRGLGCGNRRHCPTCGGYTQDVLGREAYESIMNAQSCFDIDSKAFGRPELECKGFHVVLTRPKFISEQEHLLLTDGKSKEYAVKAGEFFHLAEECIRREFGNTGSVLALHPIGETNPGEAFDHFDSYVAPFVKEGVEFIPLNHWRDVERLRRSWTAMLNAHYGLTLANSDVKVKFIKTDRQLRHVLNYLFRHPLQDIWKGLRGMDGQGAEYVYGHGKRKIVSLAELNKAYEYMALLPAHFKRIRWCGLFSDGQRSKTMEALDLRPEDIEDDGEPEPLTLRYLTLVNYLDAGMLLKANLTGELVTIPAGEIDCRPKGVTLGRRKRWHEPGWKPERAGPVRTRDRLARAVYDG